MATGSDAYLRTQILTAPPEKLQLMLYEGAIKFASQAREKITEKNWEASCELLIRAQDIILELLAGLRPQVNQSLCGKMASLYLFTYRRLVDANIEHDTKLIDDALEVLRMQRDTWIELLGKLAREHSEEETKSGVSVSA
jgi:flagellar protein FliS